MAGTLTRWDPFAELADIRSRFDRMLADFGEGRTREWTPAIDVTRDDGELVVHADVPGIKPDEIEIQVDNDTLTLSGAHDETKEEKERGYVRRERHYGGFSRSMALPAGVDAKRIHASTQDGVLEVRIPLPEVAAKEPITIKPTGGS